MAPPTTPGNETAGLIIEADVAAEGAEIREVVENATETWSVG